MKRLTTSLLLVVWVITLIVALGAPIIAHLLGTPDPAQSMTRPFDPPSPGHPLGTDTLGRDLLARMLLGNAGLIVPPACAALVATACGVLLGIASAGFPRLRPVIRLVTDVLIVIPPMIILLAVITTTGGSFASVAALAVLLSVPMSTKYLGAAARPILASEFIEVARVQGRRWPDIIIHDILPALRRPILADLGVRFVTIVFLTATAAFLAGASGSSEATWAGMVGVGLPGIKLNAWSVAAPVLAIVALTAPPALLMDQATGSGR